MSDRMMLTGSVFGSDVYIKRDDLQMKTVSFVLSYSIYVFDYSALIAPVGHADSQAPQSTHAEASICI